MRFQKVWERFSRDDKLSWVSHALIAVVLSWVFSPGIAVGYYFLREVEQVLMKKFVYKQPLTPVDHLMDVLAPAAAVGLLQLFS